jgi:hypothetical protein
MSTPFKSLAPFSPRFFEVGYAAPAGACCPGFEIDAGDDRMFNLNGLGLDSPLTITGTVTRGGLNAVSQGSITWTFISGPSSATITNPNSASPTLHMAHYLGPYVFRMTFDSGDGIISDDITIFAQKYSFDSTGLKGWNTLIGGIMPKCVFIFWVVTGPRGRRVIGSFANSDVGDIGNGTPHHTGDEVGYGDFQGEGSLLRDALGLNSSPSQKFFATILYNIPDGLGGEKTIEMPVDLIDGHHPDNSSSDAVVPPLSGPDTSYYLVPLDGSGFPAFDPTGSNNPATGAATWLSNGTPHGFQVNDYRVAQVRNHSPTITPLSPELPHG